MSEMKTCFSCNRPVLRGQSHYAFNETAQVAMLRNMLKPKADGALLQLYHSLISNWFLGLACNIC